jgi:beta-glucosidase
VKKKVRFPFGYGLSYTSFSYENLTVTKEGVSFDVRNTGSVDGAEIVQMYVSRKSRTIFRPAKELKGFQKVFLKAGQTTAVKIAFDDKTFRFFDTRTNTWEIERGEYNILIGANAGEILLSGKIMQEGTVETGKYKDAVFADYFAGTIERVSDETYQALYEKKIPDGSWSGEIRINDAVCQLYYGKGIIGRIFCGVLKAMLKISEWRGKPSLNVLFNYNMPIRGYAKMTGGFVTMDMAKAITEMANGHRIKGTGHLIRAAVNRKP